MTDAARNMTSSKDGDGKVCPFCIGNYPFYQ